MLKDLNVYIDYIDEWESKVSPHIADDVKIIKVEDTYNGLMYIKYKVRYTSRIDSKWIKYYDKELHLNHEDTLRIKRDIKIKNIIL